jgi:hypothetical protein
LATHKTKLDTTWRPDNHYYVTITSKEIHLKNSSSAINKKQDFGGTNQKLKEMEEKCNLLWIDVHLNSF